jgi:hypothetical protein
MAFHAAWPVIVMLDCGLTRYSSVPAVKLKSLPLLKEQARTGD